jgi:hypothetical protein
MKVVQIGTGCAWDDLSDIIKDQPVEILILVEPLRVHNTSIRECYKHVKNKHVLNLAISTEDLTISTEEGEKVIFYHHLDDGPRFEVAGTSKEHIIKHGLDPDRIVQSNVGSIRINQLLEKYHLNMLDILYIDAEGMDDDIIKDLDLGKYLVKKIYFENLHLKNHDIYDFLKNKGYEITPFTGKNGWTSRATKKEQSVSL